MKQSSPSGDALYRKKKKKKKKEKKRKEKKRKSVLFRKTPLYFPSLPPGYPPHLTGTFRFRNHQLN
jgi:hypothetical protein